MGYCLTTEPENAVPGKSWVMPKTHTPGSPVKERGFRYYMPEKGRWASRDPVQELGFKIAQDFHGRAIFRLTRDRLAAGLDGVASIAKHGSVDEVIVRSLSLLAAHLRAVSYEQFAASGVNLYSFARNAPINLIDLLGLKDGDPDEYPWPPPDTGDGKDGGWGDVAKALWKWFEAEHKKEIDDLKKAAEKWAKEHETATCCIVGAGASCYAIGSYTFTDKIDIPEIPLKKTVNFTISVDGCLDCSSGGESKAEIKFKWSF